MRLNGRWHFLLFGASVLLLLAFFIIDPLTFVMSFDEKQGMVGTSVGQRVVAAPLILLNIPPAIVSAFLLSWMRKVIALSPGTAAIVWCLLMIVLMWCWWWSIGYVRRRWGNQKGGDE